MTVRLQQYRRLDGKIGQNLVLYHANAVIIIVGWSIDLFRRDRISSATLSAVVKSVSDTVPFSNNRVSWFDAWLARDNVMKFWPFDVENWHDRHELYRTNLILSGAVSTSWIFDGLIFLLLGERDVWRQPAEPAERLPDAKQVKAAMNDVARLTSEVVEGRRRGRLSMNAAKLRVGRLFAEARCAHRLARLVKVVESPLSKAAYDRIVTNARRRYSERKLDWVGGSATLRPAEIVPLPPLVRSTTNRRWHIDGDDSFYDNGSHQADVLFQNYLIQLYRIAQRALPAHSVLVGEDDLASVVSNACDSLRSAGYHPDVIILPHQDRFAGALTRLPEWDRGRDNAFGESHLVS